MAIKEDTRAGLRKLLLPGAASVLGAGAGLALSRTEKLRDALPTLDDVGIGDLADDLRTKLNSVVGKGDTGGATGRSTSPLDSDEYQARRRQREERRKQRARR
jgi:hypothetical protein